MVISPHPLGNSRFTHGSVIVHKNFAHLALSLSAAQVYMIQERCWFSQIDFFVVVSTSDQNFVSFQPSQFGISPNHVSIGFSQIAFPIIVLPKDDHTDFAQEEQLSLPHWTMILAMCRGRRIQMSGHSDFRIFNNL